MGQVPLKCPFDLLPDDFFMDEILSRLDSAESIVRLGMASKRFQSLCSYPSILEFKDVSDNVGLIKYLDSFFDSRMKDNSNIKYKFRRLRMYLSENMNLPILLDFVTVHLLGKWFHKALSLNVQELILQFHGEPLDSDCYLERPELNLQDSMIPLKNLRVLSLVNIPITLNDSFGDWISTYCVSLQELNFSDVLVLPNKLTITSSSLRDFTIKGQFEELHVVSAPKLVTLRVTWSLINLERDESHPFIKISDTPNLQRFMLQNSDEAYDSLRYASSGGGGDNFPSLLCAVVLLEEASLISSSSLKRLLHDISQARILHVSDAILHKISHEGIIHYAKLFRKLSIFQVHIEGDEESRWWENTDSIMSFAISIPSLKTFKLTIRDDYYDLQTPLQWLQNALSLNVRELDLQFEDNTQYMDNSYDYLKVLELNLHHNFSSMEHLRVLTLKDIPIGLNHSFEDWVSTCCVNLRELNLTGVVVLPTKLTITSSSLRVFTIDAHFTDLHVSAPKLVILHVTWKKNLVHRDSTHEITKLSLKVSEYTPDLEDFWLSNLYTSLPLEYYNCCNGDDHNSNNNFPSLESATVLIPEIDNNISSDSLERLLLDISQTKDLCVSDTILHKISCSGIVHSGNSFHTLETLHVLRVDDEFINNTEKTIMNFVGFKIKTIKSFVKKVPSLKTFKVTILTKGSYDPLGSKTFESLADNILKLGFSRAVIFLDDNKVKVVFSPEDDETLLLQYIIKNAPRGLKFIFLYQR